MIKNFFHRKGDFQPVYFYIFILHGGWISTLTLAALHLITESLAIVAIPIFVGATQSYSYLFNKNEAAKNEIKQNP